MMKCCQNQLLPTSKMATFPAKVNWAAAAEQKRHDALQCKEMREKKHAAACK
jgi:hypothetical protein